MQPEHWAYTIPLRLRSLLRMRQHSSGPYDEELSVAVLDWLCQRERCLPIPNSPQAASEPQR